MIDSKSGKEIVYSILKMKNSNKEDYHPRQAMECQKINAK